jgi:hypothetical protein
MGLAGVLMNELDVPAEAAPAWEAVLAGDDELGVGERSPTPQPLCGANIGCADIPPHCGGEGERSRNGRSTGVKLVEDGEGVGVALEGLAAEGLRLVPKVLQAGFVGEPTGWHDSLLLGRACCPQRQAEKEVNRRS